MQYGSRILPNNFWQKVQIKGESGNECWYIPDKHRKVPQMYVLTIRRVAYQFLAYTPLRTYCAPDCETPGCIRPEHQYLYNYGLHEPLGKPLPMDHLRQETWETLWKSKKAMKLDGPKEIVKELLGNLDKKQMEKAIKLVKYLDEAENAFDVMIRDVDGSPLVWRPNYEIHRKVYRERLRREMGLDT